MTRTLLGFLLAIFSILPFSAQDKSAAGDAFPASEGTYWVYRGFVRWTQAGSNKVSQTQVTWRMEVRRVIPRPDAMAFIIMGFPADLDWSDGTAKPQESLVIQTPEHKLYRIDAEQASSVRKRLEDPSDNLNGLLTDDDLFLELPPKNGAKFCDADSMARDDGMYCWVVDSSRVMTLDNVKGAPSGPRVVFTLAYRTNPDDEEFEFAPGLGITRYEYHHHGTVADTELELVEMHTAVNQ